MAVRVVQRHGCTGGCTGVDGSGYHCRNLFASTPGIRGSVSAAVDGYGWMAIIRELAYTAARMR
jgi:hypothetical protein